jgi:DNA-binding HxlR family transcriptional regulator
MSAKFSSAPQPTPRIDSSGIDSRSFLVYPIVLATCSRDVVNEPASVFPQPHGLGMQQDSELPLNAILAYCFFISSSFKLRPFICFYVYLGNYLSCQGETITVNLEMETKSDGRKFGLPLYKGDCSIFEGYDPSSLMYETARLRNLITKRGTIEILIPLCCSTSPVRYKKFRETLKGFSSKTLAFRLHELEKSGVLERRSYNEIPPRVEYRLTPKGQELVESIINLLQWMRKWSTTTTTTTTATNLSP